MTWEVIVDGRRVVHVRVPWVGVQVAIIAFGILTYFGVRGLTEGSPQLAEQHAENLLTFETGLHLNLENEAQHLVGASQTATTFANWVYIWGHWPVILSTLVWLVLRHREAFVRLRDAMIASGLVGLLIFAAYPVAPPRLLDIGLVDTVSEQSRAYRVLQPPAFVNQYAALPSLHVGWDLLVGLSIAATASSVWVRMVGRLLPVLMAWAVVVTANHYIIDVFGGLALGLAGLGVATLLRRWRVSHPPDAGSRSSPVQVR